MKIIVIGPSLSGKTTTIRSLRPLVGSPVSEMDEELTLANGGQYPASLTLKAALTEQIIQKVLLAKDLIFFTNTDYFTIDDLKLARSRGYKIIELQAELENLLERNKKRTEIEGYQDQSQWLPDMLEYLWKIKNAGLVDKIIDAQLPTDSIVKEILGTQ